MRELALRLALHRLPMLRPAEKQMLDEIIDSEQFFRSLNPHLLGQIIGRPIKSETVDPELALRMAERDLRVCRERNIRIVSIWDAGYPAELKEIYDPPFLLFVRGTVPDNGRPMVSVVGTRHPSAAAVRAAGELGTALASDGFAVISGLAQGIDLASHIGALRGGRTGAVLGCGIDGVTPQSHRPIALRILECGGFLMSEYGPGTPAAKYHFPARNRIISGLSRAVVVVQAPTKSGALITADFALDQGRDLFVHKSGLSGPVGAGTSELAADGARIISSARDIDEEWSGVSDVAPIVREAGQRSARDAGVLEHSSETEIGSRIAEVMRAELLVRSSR